MTLPNVLYNAASYSEHGYTTTDEGVSPPDLSDAPSISNDNTGVPSIILDALSNPLDAPSSPHDTPSSLHDTPSSTPAVTLAPCDVSMSLSAATLRELEGRVQFYYGDWASLPQRISESYLDTSSHKLAAAETATSLVSITTDTAAAITISAEKTATSLTDTDINLVSRNLTTKATNSAAAAATIEASITSKTAPATASSSEAHKFDVILTSETVYNTANYAKLLDTFLACLKTDGVVYPLLQLA